MEKQNDELAARLSERVDALKAVKLSIIVSEFLDNDRDRKRSERTQLAARGHGRSVRRSTDVSGNGL